MPKLKNFITDCVLFLCGGGVVIFSELYRYYGGLSALISTALFVFALAIIITRSRN